MYREFFAVGAMLVIVGFFYRLACLVEISEACVFPQTVMAAMLILALIFLAQCAVRLARIRYRGAPAPAPAPKTPWRPVSVALACVLVYFLVMERLGFYVSGLAFYLTVSLLLQREAVTLRGAVVRLSMAAAFMGVLFILFNRILAVQVPKGMLM